MKAVILYDDKRLAARVTAMVRRAAHDAEVGELCNLKPWRLDLLIVPPSAELALRDAAEAHVLLIAIRGPLDLTPWLFAWLETWVERREFQDAVLGVLGEPLDDGAANVTLNLCEFAGRHGVGLIRNDTRLGEEKPDGFGCSLQDREQAQTSTLRQILDEQLCGLKWG